MLIISKKDSNFKAKMVKKTPLSWDSCGLVGTLYFQDFSTPKPGIILLSGSDGSIPGTNAIGEPFIEYLVEQGFVVLGLAYFAAEHLPQFLENIPLEYFVSSIQWLQSHPLVNFSKIGILGLSRGAELALILGSYFPNLTQAIACCAPCNMICGGFPHPNRSAWTYQNQPIHPFLSALSNKEEDLTEADDIQLAMKNQRIAYHANTPEDPFIIADIFTARMETSYAEKAQIPVEKIKCPLLLLSGDQDAIWPSFYFSKQILHRLKIHHSNISIQHIHYENAGHGILGSYDGPIYHPIAKFWCKLGGDPKANKIANQQSWLAISTFFQKSFSI